MSTNIMNGLSNDYYPFDPDTDYKWVVINYSINVNKPISTSWFNNWDDVVTLCNNLGKEPQFNVRVCEIKYRTL